MMNLKAKEDMILDTLKDIGIQITRYREVHYVTQAWLAKRARVPQASIARIEQGKNTSVLTLAKLARIMNYNIKLCK